MMYWKAWSIQPPLQPWLPYEVEQSTSCCSDTETSLPVLIAYADSREPIAEKAQQEPQEPWSFTLFTTPF